MLPAMLRFALASLVLLGCYDAYETEDTPVRSDAGARDSAILPIDVGPDGFVPPPPPPPRDAGPPICGEGTPSEYEGPRCSDRTRACIESCTGRDDEDECGNACVIDEPPCVDCLIGEIVECAVPATGCQAEWDAFACCRATECGRLDLFDCFNGPCLEAAEIMFDCFTPAIDRCAEAQSLCF